MPSFRFLHAADLHLGSPMEGLALSDAEARRRFAEAGRAAFERLVTEALAADAAFVVLAGDIYDGPWRDASVGLFFNRAIARLAPRPVYRLRGNHDAESVVTTAVPLPPFVQDFPVDRPGSFRIEALRVALHGQGFARREEPRNLAAGYPAPVPGWFNIGVLHSALAGRPPHAPYAPCTVEELAARGYDYWALGHVHAFEIVATAPHVVYPGVLQGRNIRETGEKGAVLVTVEDGRVAAVERLVLDEVRWALAEADLAGVATEAEAEARIAAAIAPVAAAAGGRPVALRLRLAGTTPLAARLAATRAELEAAAQAIAHQIHPDLWIEKLEIALAAPAAPAGGDPALDPGLLLDRAAADPVLLERAEAAAREILPRLPGGLAAEAEPFGAPLPALIAEARALAALRLGIAAGPGAGAGRAGAEGQGG